MFRLLCVCSCRRRLRRCRRRVRSLAGPGSRPLARFTGSHAPYRCYRLSPPSFQLLLTYLLMTRGRPAALVAAEVAVVAAQRAARRRSAAPRPLRRPGRQLHGRLSLPCPRGQGSASRRQGSHARSFVPRRLLRSALRRKLAVAAHLRPPLRPRAGARTVPRYVNECDCRLARLSRGGVGPRSWCSTGGWQRRCVDGRRLRGPGGWQRGC